jgi:hypothetical protein
MRIRARDIQCLAYSNIKKTTWNNSQIIEKIFTKEAEKQGCAMLRMAQKSRNYLLPEKTRK